MSAGGRGQRKRSDGQLKEGRHGALRRRRDYTISRVGATVFGLLCFCGVFFMTRRRMMMKDD